MKFLRNENGQTLVLTALCMTAMLGFMALALDVGLLFRARRNMQTAADSAAIAGAQDYMWNASTTTARTASEECLRRERLHGRSQRSGGHCESTSDKRT